jgi:tetratricopeptide (TPR) repeat protein
MIAGTLGLAGMALLPLAGGGYSGGGYLIALVLLPLCSALAWPQLRNPPWLAQGLLLAYGLSALALPAMLQEGRDLWGWILQLLLAWAITSLLLEQLPQRRGWLLPALSGSAVLTALYGLGIWSVSAAQGHPDARLSATFGLPNAYAGYLLVAWPAAAVVFLQSRTRLARLFWGVGVLLLLAAFALTYSRASWYVLVLQLVGTLGVIVLSALAERRKTKDERRSAPPWLWAAAPFALLAALTLLPSVRSFIAHAADFGGYSMQGRLRFWEAALAIWGDYPLLGIGPGAFGFVYPHYQRDIVFYSIDPHSWPLHLLCELGVVGGLLALGIAVGTVLWVKRVWSISKGWAPVLARAVEMDNRPAQGPAPAEMMGALPRLEAALLIAAVVGSLAHAAVDFDYTFSATTTLLGALLAYGTWRASAGPDSSRPRNENPSLGGPTKILAYATSAIFVLIAVWGVTFSAERYILDRVRDTPVMTLPVRLELFQQAVRYNPWNHATHYRLAEIYAQPGELTDRARALRELDTSLRLNPRYTPALSLRGILRHNAEGEADLKRSLDLDPWNYPAHYFTYGMLARDEAVRYERLLRGINKLGVRDPIRLDSVRPDWIKLNGLFALWYYELARLAKDEAEAAEFRRRAARFEQTAEEMEQLSKPQPAAAEVQTLNRNDRERQTI